MQTISQLRFDALASYIRDPRAPLIGEEIGWFSEAQERVLGVLIRDRIDDDFGGVILARDRKGRYRAVDLSDFGPTRGEARDLLEAKLAAAVRGSAFAGAAAAWRLSGDEQCHLPAFVYPGNERGGVLSYESRDQRKGLHEDSGHLFATQRAADQDERTHSGCSEGGTLERPVPDPPVPGQDDPALPTDLCEPRFIRRVSRKVVVMGTHLGTRRA